MRASRSLLFLGALAIAGLLIAASPNETPPGCRLDDASTSLLRIYECQEKLRIAAEAATRLSAIQQDGRLVGLRVGGGAVLVEASGRDGFRVVTAEAVTELRRAQVAVDSGEGSTSVFVREGGASVSQEGRSVRLRAGQGVDVANPPPAPASEPAEERPRATPGARPPAMPQARPPSTIESRPPVPSPWAEPPGTEPRAGTARPGRGLAVAVWSPERAGRLMARLGRR